MGLRALIVFFIGFLNTANGGDGRAINQIVARMNPKLARTDVMYISNRITEYALENNLDPRLVCALIAVESRFNPLAYGPIGEVGLMQLRPEYHALQIDDIAVRRAYLIDVQANLSYGISYLASLKASYGTRYTKYRWIEKYNSGPHKHTVTFKYTAKVLKYYDLFKRQYDL